MSSHCKVLAEILQLLEPYRQIMNHCKRICSVKNPKSSPLLRSATGSPSGTRLNMADLGPRKSMNPVFDNLRNNSDVLSRYVGI